MFDRGLNLTLQAIRRQLAAMPNDLYLVRLIHHQTRRAFPGERLWTAAQLFHPATVRFLRVRNREGCDIYIHPYAQERNAGYILVDLDQASPVVVETMRGNGHGPCVVVETSPHNLQAWVHVSTTPIEPAVANCIGKQLAHIYGGDRASTDWRHLGRLAGFTNQKPQRRNARGYPPWVKVWHAHAGLAAEGAALLRIAERHWCSRTNEPPSPRIRLAPLAGDAASHTDLSTNSTAVAEAARIYRSWLQRLRIVERFPQPDWSIADKWIAKELLQRGTSTERVAAILQCGSPHFPRRHSNPQDYLHRTIARATLELQATSFPRRDCFFHTAAAPPPGS
jgi:hypothetical protein